VTLLCVVVVSFGLSAEHWLAGYHGWLRQLAAAGCPPPDARSGDFHVTNPGVCLALKGRYPGSMQAAFASRYNFAILLSQYGLTAVFAIMGAIVGAPLVAREVEQRTHLAAWTQSVSRRRWYLAKISVLAAGLAVAGLAAGTANAWLQRELPGWQLDPRLRGRRSGLLSPRWPVLAARARAARRPARARRGGAGNGLAGDPGTLRLGGASGNAAR